ncbi:MAG: carbon-nitrogen hydrolase family protein [Rhodospirillales bacterium]|jgi:predicted amidohydrolase|tara:strand:- start:379 stop:1218 length:840 start_codon:yes stop_codon:yes gene_type:complete
MVQTFTVACVQTTAGPDVKTNIINASALVREAHKSGATLIVLPEVTNIIDMDRSAMAEKLSAEVDDISLVAFCTLAVELKVWLLLGSLGLKHETALNAEGKPKFANRSFLIGDDGVVRNRYTKIHLFDVDLGAGETYQESKSYEPGNETVVADTPWGKLGMTICYDIRFPHLYRKLAQAGAKFLSIPAAFARPSGKAHWHVLMRARAIENGCYVFAAAQCGEHGGGRSTYGHSLIVDPWGEILADGGTEIGFVLAEIDTSLVDKVRQKIPSLTHDRDYS